MRVKSLNFLPQSVNFSRLSEGVEGSFYDQSDEFADVDKELILLKYLTNLNSDKERIVLLIEVLRELGYQIDYASVASSLKVGWRWYMRMKKNVKKKAEEISNNT